MSRLDDAKKNYDDIPIPEELSKRVQEAINHSTARRAEKQKVIQMRKRRMWGRSVGAAAAVVLTFTTVLNTNTAFAEAVSKVPVIKEISRVLTFKLSDDENQDISIEVPDIEMIKSNTNGLADSINQEIQKRCQQYAEESVKRAEEYKKAFLETGGTEEEWQAHKLEIKVWYDVKSQTENHLSFMVGGSESWSSAHNESQYYNIDLKTEKTITLKDILGENYIQIANESILAQMKTRKLEGDMPFWTPEKGGFTTITDQTKFYINENGNPVIVFDKYEIAPGAAGEIEFEIPLNKSLAESSGESAAETETPETAESETVTEMYEDNFAVPAEATADFAKKIKAAVADKNLEALADLASYPLYVGLKDSSVSVTSKEEFVALGAEKIFTPEMLASIEAADETTLAPSMAGFSLTENGRPNIIFGITDGKLTIKGINY